MIAKMVCDVLDSKNENDPSMSFEMEEVKCE